MKPAIRCVLLALLALLVIAAPAGATVYTVMPGIDPDSTPCPPAAAGTGTCSLREALAAVNAGAGGDTIMLPAGNYPNIQGAEFPISKTVTILGAGSATTTVNGSPSSRVFDVTAPVVATISDVTITGGNAVGAGGGGVEVNSASGNPALVMAGDAVINNSATEEGGGIDFQRPGHADQGGTLTLSDSLVANNQVSNTSDPHVLGGGIVLTSGGTLTNVTVTGNSLIGAGSFGGGGIANLGSAPVTIASSTIAGNSLSDTNAGPESGGNLSGNSVRLLDSIVAGGSGPAGMQNCGVPEISLGHNLEDLNQCGLTGPGDQVNKNPMLGTLAAIPNAASTLALMTGSPAINAGDAACTTATGAPLTHDQRGLPRPQGSACDIGAFEFQLPSFANPPALSGGPQVGQQLSCTAPPAPSSPDGPETVAGPVLVRDGMATTTAFPYTIAASDAGHTVACGESATNAAGTATSTSAAITATSTSAAITVANQRPSISSLKQSASTWREGSKLARISAKREPPVGTTFSFNLNQPATVTLTFTQSAVGRKTGGKCVAQMSHNKHKQRCRLVGVVGRLQFSAHQGINHVLFQGRVSRTHRLKPGSYTLVVIATANGKTSRPSTLNFRIAAP